MEDVATLKRTGNPIVRRDRVSQVVAGKAPAAKRFRIGGMVVKGSVTRRPGDLQVRFVLTDFAHQVPVEYTGVLPDLFREGQGIIAHGTMNANGAFVADEVLAKSRGQHLGDLGLANAGFALEE